MSVLIIAEAGVNHNGDLDRALALVDAAAEAGADVVKFQTFRAAAIASSKAPKAHYQTETTGESESQLDMLRRLELDENAHRRLLARCAERGIEFLSTPFDLQSLDLLVGGLGLKTLKIPSGEVTNAPLLLAAARSGCRLIASTGMCTLDEVSDMLGILAFGMTQPASVKPSAAAFGDAFASTAGQTALRRNVTLLHCTTEYPAPLNETNLHAMATLERAFGLPVGFSDHTQGITAAIAAAALGAVVVEKHFTLDKSLPGPDHRASLDPIELTRMVRAIRETSLALGSGDKQPSASEQRNKVVARKSLVALGAIDKGAVFTERNLGVKRPGNGLSPLLYWDWLGQVADRDYDDGDLIGS